MTTTLKRKPKRTATPIAEPKSLAGEPLPLSPLQLVRHPDNRRPTEASIAAVAESFASEGQIEAVLVRCIRAVDEFVSTRTYQIISGETRWLAAKRLNWDSLDCEVVELDDAATLRVLAAANAARQDVDPIAQAKLIIRLCDPIDKGGSGLTREAAAKMFALQSGGAASNLVRLLELPEKWQELVASGALPQSYARELLALLPLGEDSGAWGDAFVEWDRRGEYCQWDPPVFNSRESLAEFVKCEIRDHSRPIEKGDAREYHADTRDYSAHPIRFKLTPELERSLRIVELPIDGKTIRRATNCELYDLHQVPAIKAWLAKKNKGKPIADDDEPAAADRKLTSKQQAAEDAERKEKAAEVLAKRIEKWRAAWLRELVAVEISRGVHTALATRICLWLQVQSRSVNYREWELMRIEDSLAKAWARKDAWIGVLLGDNATASAQIVSEWLRAPVRDGYEHPMPDDHVEDLVELLKIDLGGRWDLLQSDPSQRERFEEFFTLHNSEQLDALGRELGVHTQAAKSKSVKVQLFTALPRTLKLPKCLRSLRKRGG